MHGLWMQIGDFWLFWVVAIVFVVSFCGKNCARIQGVMYLFDFNPWFVFSHFNRFFGQDTS